MVRHLFLTWMAEMSRRTKNDQGQQRSTESKIPFKRKHLKIFLIYGCYYIKSLIIIIILLPCRAGLGMDYILTSILHWWECETKNVSLIIMKFSIYKIHFSWKLWSHCKSWLLKKSLSLRTFNQFWEDNVCSLVKKKKKITLLSSFSHKSFI